MKSKFAGLILTLIWGSCINFPLYSQQVDYKVNSMTGSIERIGIRNSHPGMNWLQETDGSQYSWVGENYGWGLGYFSETQNGKTAKYKWEKPDKIYEAGHVSYSIGNIYIDVQRKAVGNDLFERYSFCNKGKSTVSISDIGIYTPFNDNYPDAKTCTTARTNVHIWDGDNAGYVSATHMSGTGPHLGLVLKEGSIKSYQISERDLKKGLSNTRGIISLNVPDMRLRPGEKYNLSWKLFPFSNQMEFNDKIINENNVYVDCNKYVFEKGETASLSLYSKQILKGLKILKDGKNIPFVRKNGRYTLETKMDKPGEVRFDFYYSGDKKTHANCLVVSSYDNLIQKRCNFIIEKQQMNDREDPRYGAYMVYDNESNRIFLNDRPSVSPNDRDEGAERLGMGVLLAKQYLLKQEPAVKASLLKYTDFVRNKLQDKDYATWSTIDHKSRNRAYNYPWVANLYFYMYKITKDKKYANDGFQTLQAMFHHFGYGFYAIDIPVHLGLNCLKEAGLTDSYDKLKSDFIKAGDVYVQNSLNYPKHEVNFEQSIVAPSVIFLLQLYMETKDDKYKKEAQRQMPVLESFGGYQPSFHLNEISNRHWDGYWFGKREMWGDVFPHYWSTLTAVAYYYHSLCFQDASYLERAKNIVRNNLCLFFENGSASCAYLYPSKVDGVKAQFYDPYANDQDWALVYYLLVNDKI